MFIIINFNNLLLLLSLLLLLLLLLFSLSLSLLLLLLLLSLLLLTAFSKIPQKDPERESQIIKNNIPTTRTSRGLINNPLQQGWK